MCKKGQTLVDFLITYGWAIIVILVAAGAVFYFDLLGPKIGTCKFTENIECIDSVISEEGILTLVLKNNAGYPITVSKGINASNSCNSTVIDNINGNSAFPVLINTSSKIKATIICGQSDVSKFKSIIVMNYENVESGLTHKSKGAVYHTS